MKGLPRIGLLAAAGLAVGLAGCRHTCRDRCRDDGDRCEPSRFAVGPRAARSAACCDPLAAAAVGARGPVIGAPVSSGPIGSVPGPFAPPFAPTPPLPNELPQPTETIPAPAIPIPAGPSAANVLPPPGAIPPVSRPTGLPK